MDVIGGGRRGTLILAIVLALVSPGVATASASDKTGESIKGMGKEMKEFGRKVGKAGKEAGLSIADAARKVWYKSWRVSGPKLDQIQKTTQGYWAQVLKAKDLTLSELRRENAELKRRLAEREKGR